MLKYSLNEIFPSIKYQYINYFLKVVSFKEIIPLSKINFKLWYLYLKKKKKFFLPRFSLLLIILVAKLTRVMLYKNNYKGINPATVVILSSLFLGIYRLNINIQIHYKMCTNVKHKQYI